LNGIEDEDIEENKNIDERNNQMARKDT